MIWRTFITCSFAVFTLGSLELGTAGHGTESGAETKFGKAKVEEVSAVQGIPAAIVIGIVGGILGAFFINVNFRMNALRKQCLKSNWIKPVETGIWCLMSASCFFLVPRYLSGSCVSRDKVSGNEDLHYRAWCKDPNSLDPNASIFWSAEGEIIRNLMNNEIPIELVNVAIFLGCWYIFTITTYGTNVPAGLFLPGMIIGCALGKVMFMLANDWGIVFGTDEEKMQVQTHYIILACGGFMAGYTRMTYSLAVILMETSQSIEIFVPMVLCIAVSNYTGYFFTRSLYERATRGKQMPIILEDVPSQNHGVIAE